MVIVMVLTLSPYYPKMGEKDKKGNHGFKGTFGGKLVKGGAGISSIVKALANELG